MIVRVVADRVATADGAGQRGMEADPAAGEEERRRHAAAPQRPQNGSSPACGFAAAVEGESDHLLVCRQTIELVELRGGARARRQREHGHESYARRHPDSTSSRTSSTPACQTRSMSSSGRW